LDSFEFKLFFTFSTVFALLTYIKRNAGNAWRLGMAAHAGTALHQAPGERSIAAAHQADCGAMGLRLARWQLRQQMAGTEIGMWIVWWIGAHKTMIQVLPCFKDLMRKKTSIQQGMFFLLLLAYYLNQ
jgi:hypothetical protein